MIEIQLTLEALRVFNLPKCQKAANVGESSKGLPAVQGRCEQLCQKHCLFLFFSRQGRTLKPSLLIWMTVMELLLYCPWRGHIRSLGLALQFPWTRSVSSSGLFLSPHTGGWQKIYIHSFGLKVVGGPIGNTRRNGLFWSCRSFQVRKLNAITSPWKQSSVSWSTSKACLLQCRSHCRIKAVRRSDRNIRNKNLKDQY